MSLTQKEKLVFLIGEIRLPLKIKSKVGILCPKGINRDVGATPGSKGPTQKTNKSCEFWTQSDIGK